MKTFLIILAILAVGAAVYYFLWKKGKINDRDKDYIPDEIEDAADKVKDAAKEVKRRAIINFTSFIKTEIVNSCSDY